MGRFRVSRGLALPLESNQNISIQPPPPIHTVAIVPDDYVGCRPRVRVQEGDRVKRGSLIFEDGSTSGVRYTSLGAGTVTAINRGARRALQSVVITLDETDLMLAEPGSCLRPAEKPIPLIDTFAEELRYLLGEEGYQKIQKAS